MAQQIINNGTFDNDPSAEKIRTAFDKVNVNTTELYNDKENISNKSTNVETDQASNTKYPSVKSVYDWAVGKFQNILVSGTNIKTINGSSVLGSGNLVVSGLRKQTYTLTRDWLTSTLDRVYYISFNNNAIEHRPSGTNNTVIDSLQGRNAGMLIAPYNCKVTKIICTTRNTGSFTGKLGLGSGKINTTSIGADFTNKIVHLDSAITSAGFFLNEYVFPIVGGATITAGDVISPTLYFSAQAQTTKSGVTIQIEIEEV